MKYYIYIKIAYDWGIIPASIHHFIFERYLEGCSPNFDEHKVISVQLKTFPNYHIDQG